MSGKHNITAGLYRGAIALVGLVLLALAALSYHPAPAHAQFMERWPGRWVMLAAHDIAPGSSTARIDLGATSTAFKALRIHNKGPELTIEGLLVSYADGSSYESRKPLKIAAGSRSWPIDFRRSHKFVDALELTLQPLEWQSRIEVWGLQDSHGSKAKRPPRRDAPTAATEPPAPPSVAGAPAEPATTAAPEPQSPPLPATRGITRAPEPRPAPGGDGAKVAEQQADWQIVPVYYGTDRSGDPGAKRVNYTSERARRLELGRALVTVPRIHAVPVIERPWVLRVPYLQYTIYEQAEDPAKHFTIKEIAKLTRAEMLRLVRERLALSATFKDHAIVFVHGFNTSFDNAVYRTAQLAYDLKFDGAPFVYSWPSKGQLGVQDYNYDRESAGQAEPHLKSFLDLVVSESGAKHVSIIAHSMGNQVLLPALRDIKRDLPEDVFLHQVILAAPDVDRDNFEFLAREVEGVSRGITLYAAANDRALAASRRFAGGIPRAGDVPAGGPIVVPGVDTIDVTATSTDMLALNHAGFAEKTALLNDLQLLIQTGERPPHRRIPILERIATDKGEYWRYPAVR